MFKTPITAYHYHSDLLSVILGDNEGWNWLYNNYINLEVTPYKYNSRSSERLDYSLPFYFSEVWANCPLVSCQRLSLDFVNAKWERFTDFLTFCIDNGYYIRFWCDRFYLNRYGSHYYHDTFVYGYDDEEKTFDITEHDYGGKYTHFTVSYEDVEAAYKEAPEVTPDTSEPDIQLISYEKRHHHYLDIGYIIQSIKDYLNGVNSYKRVIFDAHKKLVSQRMIYGIKTYENLYFYLSHVLSDTQIRDYRLPHVFAEHKEVMLLRIKCLAEPGYLNNAQFIYSIYKNTVSKPASKAKMMLLKYYITENNDLLQRIIDTYKSIETVERQTLEILLENISEYPMFEHMTICENAPSGVASHNVIVLPKEKVHIKLGELLQQYSNKVDVSFDQKTVAFDVSIEDNGINILGLQEGSGRVVLKNTIGEPVAEYHIYIKPCVFHSNIRRWDERCRGKWDRHLDGIIGIGSEQILFADTEKDTDFVFEADAQMLHQDAYCIFGTHVNENFRKANCIVVDTRDGKVKYSNGQRNFREKALGIKPNTTHYINVGLSDNVMKVYVDDQFCFDYSDPEYTTGRIKVKSMNGVVRFQNINYKPCK